MQSVTAAVGPTFPQLVGLLGCLPASVPAHPPALIFVSTAGTDEAAASLYRPSPLLCATHADTWHKFKSKPGTNFTVLAADKGRMRLSAVVGPGGINGKHPFMRAVELRLGTTIVTARLAKTSKRWKLTGMRV